MSTVSEPVFWITPESIFALRHSYEHSTKGNWYAEASMTKPAISITGNGLRSIVARLDENCLCPEHGGSALVNAIFIARAHEMMPFLLACVDVAKQAATGELAGDALQAKAQRIFD